MKQTLFAKLKQSLIEAKQIKVGAIKPAHVSSITPKGDTAKTHGNLVHLRKRAT